MMPEEPYRAICSGLLRAVHGFLNAPNKDHDQKLAQLITVADISSLQFVEHDMQRANWDCAPEEEKT